MSFSATLKSELCNLRMSDCCRKAECYGIMLFGQSFSNEKISILTDNETVAQNFIFLLKRCFGVNAVRVSSDGKRPMHKVTVANHMDCEKIIADTCNSEIINQDIISKDCCRDAFIRGAFLACGQMQNPEKGFRAEFCIKNPLITDVFTDILLNRGLAPNRTKRGERHILYFKKSGSVEDLITVMGTAGITLDLIEVKILKEVRNNINRRNNVDMANLSKTTDASVRQRSAVKYLIDKGKFDILPTELQEIALLRTANPEATLAELCRLSNISLTRSGMNHRLQRIMEIAEEYKSKE